jgi:tetratricopeptide (TPR) repeat protein
MVRYCALLLGIVTVCAARVGAQHNHDATPGTSPQPVPLFQDLGTHRHTITTSVPQAQQYFDQGLRLVFAFNHDEAIRAFSEAARLDPQCAMCYWGIGFAYGPNYNLPLDDARNREAHAATQQAQALAPRASEPEQAYITALATRYSLDPKADRAALDRAFADAMRALACRYPTDLDAATLFAESMMDLRPWDLWTLDGKPQPGTGEIVETLERVLKANPFHPGANHYYIHAVEASPHPERALPAAHRIGLLVPGAGHLVHMPSHIYMRVGQYALATEANRQAVAVDRQYIERVKPGGVYPVMYYPHNLHFLWAAASMEGRSADALQAAHELVASVSADDMRQMPMLEYFAPAEWFGLARFGKWDAILHQPAPPDDLRYVSGMWHYARGLAFLGTGKLAQATKEQAAVAAAAAAMPAQRIIGDNIPAAAVLRLASRALLGELAARQGKPREAVKHLREAIRIQDGLPYTEPPPFYYPVRQSLGAVLLAARQAKEAETVYREDLTRNPENGWSLYGLMQSLTAQGQSDAALATRKRFAAAWARADVTLTASRF